MGDKELGRRADERRPPRRRIPLPPSNRNMGDRVCLVTEARRGLLGDDNAGLHVIASRRRMLPVFLRGGERGGSSSTFGCRFLRVIDEKEEFGDS
jgi:hypothetical protein